MRFQPNGEVRINDSDGVVGSFDGYDIGRVFPVELTYDMDAGTYDVIIDGDTIVVGEPHGSDPTRGIGSVMFGTANDADSLGTIYVDNLHVWTGNIAPPMVVAHLDIKPGSCPNPLNVKNLDEEPKNPKSNRGGVLPVALLGSEDFDVSDVDVSTLLLEGVAPLRYSHEDVGAPGGRPKDECECESTETDGYADLTLKFKKSDVAAALGDVYDGDMVPLTITGKLLDGTEFSAFDCVRILGHDRPGEPDPDRRGDSDGVVLKAAHPNPFNPATTIVFRAERGDRTELAVFDLRGRLVRTLLSGTASATGVRSIPWNGIDDRGRAIAGVIGQHEDPVGPEHPRQRNAGADAAIGSVDALERQSVERSSRIAEQFHERLAVVGSDRVVEDLGNQRRRGADSGDRGDRCDEARDDRRRSGRASSRRRSASIGRRETRGVRAVFDFVHGFHSPGPVRG